MRAIVLLPLSLIAVVVGCGSEAREQATPTLPPRDLTLMTQAAEVKIASPVEMRPPQRPSRRAPTHRSGALDPKLILAAAAAPLAAPGAGSAPILAAAEPVLPPARPASAPANDRELLPGKTVTLIPASSGPSTSVETPDELPPREGGTMVVRGGGKCGGRGRGPGIGIAAAPRPAFR